MPDKDTNVLRISAGDNGVPEKVELNGVALENVRRVEFQVGPQELLMATIEVYADEVQVEMLKSHTHVNALPYCGKCRRAVPKE